MPSPLIYARVSGLFVRFRVPNDLRARVRSQFVVRALDRVDPDTGRLLAAVGLTFGNNSWRRAIVT